MLLRKPQRDARVLIASPGIAVGARPCHRKANLETFDPLMDLDQLYGHSFVPEKDVSAAEKAFTPQSRDKLTEKSASLLRAHMETTTSGLLLSQVVHGCSPILWLMDRGGQIWFALEEVVSVDRGKTACAYPRSGLRFKLPDTHTRLGHPSLLDGDKTARIAGEIIFDPLFGNHGWVISNSSGRYGIVKHRQRTHLDHVNREFSKFGLMFDVDYIEYQERR